MNRIVMFKEHYVYLRFCGTNRIEVLNLNFLIEIILYLLTRIHNGVI